MPDDGLTRRRFLAVGGGAVAAGVAGLIAWLTRVGGEAEVAGATTTASITTGAVPNTIARATTTTVPAATTPGTSSVATTTTTAAAATTTTSPAGLTIAVIPKAAWGAVPVAGEFTPHVIEEITVHHTAVMLETNADAPARARQHQAYHQSLGWPDLAYHFLVDANGHVYEGRPLDAAGDTATNYEPAGHLLICCEGDFDRQRIGTAQYGALVAMLAWGSTQYGVATAAIKGHRDLAATSCPGDDLYAYLSDGRLAAAVDEQIASGPARLELLDTESALALVAAIEAGSV